MECGEYSEAIGVRLQEGKAWVGDAVVGVARGRHALTVAVFNAAVNQELRRSWIILRDGAEAFLSAAAV